MFCNKKCRCNRLWRSGNLVLDGKADIMVTHAEVRRVMQVMEAAFALAEQGQTMKVDI